MQNVQKKLKKTSQKTTQIFKKSTNKGKKNTKKQSKMSTKTLRKNITNIRNTIQFLQRDYRPRPKRTHTWDKHVSEQLHKSASIGPKKHQKNSKNTAKIEQKLPTKIDGK